MTTEPAGHRSSRDDLRAGGWRLLLAVALAVLPACAGDGFGRRGGLTEGQVAALPPAIQEPYDVFAYKCSRCHTLARPLSAPITSPDHWEAYVARMRRHAGSAISAEDASTILVFLRHLAEEKARSLAEKRGDPPPPPPPPADGAPEQGGARP